MWLMRGILLIFALIASNVAVYPIPSFDERLYTVDEPIPVFEYSVYEAQYEENAIDPIEIKFDTSVTTDKPTVKIEPSYADYFKCEENKFSSTDSLPEDTFNGREYITVKIEASYNVASGSDKAAVIIKAPVKQEIPVFEQSVYEAQYTENDIDPIEIKFDTSISTEKPTVIIETKYANYFKCEDNMFSSKNPLPDDTFVGKEYISVTIEAYYKTASGSAKAAVIIKAPVKQEIPVFEQSVYEAQYKENDIDPIEIKFDTSISTEKPTVIIETKYANYFKCEDNMFSSKDPLPDDTFVGKEYITVTIEAYYNRDSGSAKAAVIIKAPVKPEIPVFEHSVYEVQYKENDIDPIEIKFEPSTSTHKPTVIVETKYADYFKWQDDIFSSKDPLPEDTFDGREYITVTIEAYYKQVSGSAKAAVIIKAPVKECDDQIPVFDKSVYEAQYKENEIDPIEIKFDTSTTTDILTISIESKYAYNFKWENYIFSSIDSLPQDTFDGKEYITVTIEAYYNRDSGSAKTAVIIKAPVKEGDGPIPVFDKSVYEAQYMENEIDPIEIKFETSTSTDKPTVILETKYADYFKYDDNIFSSTTPLPDDTFFAKAYITVTIEAYYDKEKGSDKAVVIINAPVKKFDEPIPDFEKSVYEGHYKKTGEMKVIDIKLDTSSSEAKPTVEIETKYANNFEWENDKFFLKNPLPSGTFDHIHYITVTIEAYFEKEKGSNKAVVIIMHEDQKVLIPVFEKSIYEGQYKESGEMKIIDIKLNTLSSEAEPTVEIETKYASYFEWENDNFFLKNPLPPDTFDHVHYITVTIEAYFEKEKGSNKAVVIIVHEDQKVLLPVFEKSIYEGQYKETGEMKVIDIKFDTSSSEDDPIVEIETKYASNFEWENNNFFLKNPLPPGTFDHVHYITVTIEAYFNKEKGSNKAVVIIMHEDQKVLIPDFEKSIYEGEYKETGEMKVIDIKLDSSSSEADPTVEIETKYASNFKWENDKFFLKNPLPPGTFDDVDYITVTIEAYFDKAKGSGKTVVIIIAPEDDDDNEEQVAVFENPFYKTQYNNDDSIDPVVIRLISSTPEPVFEIESQYKAFFKFENDKFELIAKLPKHTFDEVNYITVIIRAFYESSKLSGQTVVIIDSPKQTGHCNMPGNKEWENMDFLFDVNDAGKNTKTYGVENIAGVDLNLKYVKWDFNEDKTQITFSVTPEFDKYIENEDTFRTRVKIYFTCADGTTKHGDFNFDVEQTIFFKPEINKELLEFDLQMPILEQTIIPAVQIKAKDINLGDMKLYFSVLGECSVLFDFDVTKKDKKIYSTHLKTKDRLVDLHDSMSCYIQVTNYMGSSEMVTMILNVASQNSDVPNPIFVKPLYEANYIDERNIEHEDIELQPTNYTATYTIYIDKELEGYFEFSHKRLILEKDLPITAFHNKNYISVTIQANYETAKSPGKTVLIINAPKIC